MLVLSIRSAGIKYFSIRKIKNYDILSKQINFICLKNNYKSFSSTILIFLNIFIFKIYWNALDVIYVNPNFRNFFDLTYYFYYRLVFKNTMSKYLVS